MKKKLSEAKRIKHARQHLRDCPKVDWDYCPECAKARAVLKELGLEAP